MHSQPEKASPDNQSIVGWWVSKPPTTSSREFCASFQDVVSRVMVFYDVQLGFWRTVRSLIIDKVIIWEAESSLFSE